MPEHGFPDAVSTTRFVPADADGNPGPLAENDVAADNANVIPELHALFLDHLREHGTTDRLVALWKNP